MPMISVEAAILVSKPFVWIAFQLGQPSQRRVVLYLHMNLIQQGIYWHEVDNPPK